MVQLSGNCQLPYWATVGWATVVGQLLLSNSIGLVLPLVGLMLGRATVGQATVGQATVSWATVNREKISPPRTQH